MKGSAATVRDVRQRSDEELLALSITHPDVFEELLKRYQEAFLRKAQAVIGRREDAEDIVQETFTKIYLNASSFKKQEGASFSSWAYKILLNTSFTHYRRKKRDWSAVVHPDPEFFEALPDLKSKFSEHAILAEYIGSVIERMPQNLARALRLHFIEGRPQREVAELEGVSVGAIKTRVHRAKEIFRNISADIS